MAKSQLIVASFSYIFIMLPRCVAVSVAALLCSDSYCQRHNFFAITPCCCHYCSIAAGLLFFLEVMVLLWWLSPLVRMLAHRCFCSLSPCQLSKNSFLMQWLTPLAVGNTVANALTMVLPLSLCVCISHG